jgi:crotonobetainyl-CoA:carnitine CoA-transferase CaiB-like acyl-CoA transferase
MTEAPLAGIRVLDASQVLSGPYCSMMLADAGADVIKVEPVDGGDHVRSWLTDGETAFSAYFYAANRSKRSVTINLKRPEGRALFLDLAAKSDVVLENFRPGVMARLGVAYADVRERNPRAVYCSVSGFGQDGPLSRKAAYDLIAAGYGGTMSVTGDPGGRYVRPGVPVSDLLAAMAAAYSILLALRTRETTGEGAYIDISLLDAQLFAMSHHLVAYQVTGREPGLHGSAHPQVAPYQTFRTADGDMNVAVLAEKQWQAFCEVVGHDEWLRDERYTTAGSRNVHRRELERDIEGALASRPAREWIPTLEGAGIACGPINTTRDLVSNAHLEQRSMYLDVKTADAGTLRIPGAPWRAPGVLNTWSAPPALGEHTDEVLRDVLGFDEAKIGALRRSGVVAPAEERTPAAGGRK